MAAKDKIKRMQQAEKFVLQGKIANAIAEYQKIAEESPSDVQVLNTIGDLYVRLKQPQQGIIYFTRVVEAYVKSGFNSKACAMQKKVVNLDPHNLDALSKLAELYVKQGLSVEARSQYLALAGLWEKKGHDREASEFYRKAIELNPDDPQTELRLAELYVKQKNKDQAKVFYSSAGMHLATANQVEVSRKALERALGVDPRYVPALKGCVQLSRMSGQYDEILQRLEETHRTQPGQVDVMELLGEVYLAVNRPEEAEAFLRDVLNLDQNRYEHFFTLAAYYYNNTELDKALQQIQTVTAVMLSRREPERIIKGLQDIIELDPKHMAALSQLAEVYNKINNKKEYVAILSKIADLYIGEENYKAALPVVEQILENDLSDAKFLQMHREIFHEAFPGEPYRSPVPESSNEEAIELASEVISQSVTQPPADEPATIALDAGADAEIDLSNDLEDIFKPTPPKKEPDKPVKTVEPRETWGTIELPPPEEKPLAAAEPKSPLETSLQEVDFYINLGFLEEAQNKLVELAQTTPGHPGIMHRYEQLQEEARASGVTLPDVVWPVAPAEGGPSAGPNPIGPATDESPARNDTIELIEGSLDTDESSRGAEAPLKYSIRRLEGIRPAETNGPEQDKFKPFSEMVEEIKNFIGTDKEEDFQTQFDLGLAYKQMGLLDEALGQFQAAHRLAKEGGAHKHMALCCNLLATCFLEKEKPASAIKWCKLGLAAPGLSDDEVHALKYELAAAHEKCGDVKQALECLNEIYEMNINYRDVAQRISQLSNLVKAK